MTTKQNQSTLNLSKKICPECGQMMKEQIESYLMECDRCLSKKPE
ncbi:YhfH family protein [Bacillus sp. V3B]|nr:protein YhfH [Bacillus sp. V3B]MCQ6276171.1 YhfH family protein [Bacillus sp. V3B]